VHACSTGAHSGPASLFRAPLLLEHSVDIATDRRTGVAGPEQYAAQQGMSLAMVAAIRLPQFRAKMFMQALPESLVSLVAGRCPDDDLAGQMVRVYVPSSI